MHNINTQSTNETQKQPEWKQVIASRAIVFAPNNTMLIASQDGKMWHFCGGWTEKGETTQSACKREAYEETGIEITVQKAICMQEILRDTRETFGDLMHKLEIFWICECSETQINTNWQDFDDNRIKHKKFITEKQWLDPEINKTIYSPPQIQGLTFNQIKQIPNIYSSKTDSSLQNLPPIHKKSHNYATNTANSTNASGNTNATGGTSQANNSQANNSQASQSSNETQSHTRLTAPQNHQISTASTQTREMDLFSTPHTTALTTTQTTQNKPTTPTTQTMHSTKQSSTGQQITAPNITTYTDGACSGNPGKGGWGFVVVANEKETTKNGYDPETTNNRMEMMAVIQSLPHISTTYNLTKQTDVNIYVDSQYVKKGIEEWIFNWKKNGWRNSKKEPVANKDLWEQLDEKNQHIKSKANVNWHWVKGHSVSRLNNIADKLATDAIKNQQ